MNRTSAAKLLHPIKYERRGILSCCDEARYDMFPLSYRLL
jgi:hypothetical protein